MEKGKVMKNKMMGQGEKKEEEKENVEVRFH